ncbi:MAG: 5-formyltetrahydrofolate cyclo-ligase [Clostridia bacterium]|nr:5-formyltetrahydrofolate cyclo-ligase [Deltaproteobacteria bacterium]
MTSSNDATSRPTAAPTKFELRHALRALRDRHFGLQRDHLSEQAAQALMSWTELGRARRVAAFVSLGDEIDTAPLMRELRHRGIEVVLPRVERKHISLSFALAEPRGKFVDGPFGLKEPAGPAVELNSVDVVVTPGLGFDRSGGRLGYGVGYYDRALANYAGICVGFCYAVQLVAEPLPRAPHDVRVTAVAHEHGLILCEPSL